MKEVSKKGGCRVKDAMTSPEFWEVSRVREDLTFVDF